MEIKKERIPFMQEYTSCKAAISHCLETKTFAVAHLYQDEKTMNIHIHDCYEIFYSISGGKQFLINNKFYDIKPGDLFVINQFESHYLSQIDQTVLERIVLSVHPDYVKTLSTPQTNLDICFTERPKQFSHRISLTKEQQKRYMYFINKITSNSGYGNDIIEKSAFMELLVLLNSFYYISTQKESTISTYTYNHQVEEMISFINQHIQEPITIEILAKHFYLSDSYICRMFKSATGTTINKYMIARRISIAKSLLASGLNVNDVCEQCGFRDYSNFLKAFTRAVGISPKKYAQCCNS